MEKRLLQMAIGLCCVVPICGGLIGAIEGPDIISPVADEALVSHFRYLSGLLFAIGVGFISTIPNIDASCDRFSLLSFIVVVGGMARLFGVLYDGYPSAPMVFALAMEIAIVPLLWLWQRRVSALNLDR